MTNRLFVLSFFIVLLCATSSTAFAKGLDEMSLDRWAKLREVERYQLNIAEKYYREKNYKVAAAEYEKFLTLYEASEGAAYSQLKWSLCQIQLKQHNTAIKEGFQSVLDYWPDAPEAVAAAYFIGRSYKDIGEIRKAKKAYQVVLDDYGQHVAAVYATADLIDIATIEKDDDARVQYWKRLVFDTKRNKETRRYCDEAASQLATHQFRSAAFSEGVKALQASWANDELISQMTRYVKDAVRELAKSAESKSKAERLADEAVAWLKKNQANGSEEDQKQSVLNSWYSMAEIYAASGRTDLVAETYDQLIDRFGASDETLKRIGDWYKSNDQFDKAREHYTKFENSIEGRNQVAYSFRQQQKYDSAVRQYLQNVAEDPDNQAKWNAEAAMAWREARKPDQAVGIYTELIKSDSENTERWLWEIAQTYRYAGKYKEAIGYYRQCNNFPRNYQEMAACHRAMKEYGEAISLYNQIVGGAPKSAPWAMLQIGNTHEQSGNRESAIRTLQKLCRTFPKDRYASQAHAHLQSKYKITVTLGGAKDD